MEKVIDFIRPIFSGLVAFIFLYLMVKFTKPKGKREGSKVYMDYNLGFKIFTIILMPGSLFVAYAASQASSDQIIIAAIIASLFLAAGIFFPYQVFLVSFSYDKNNVYYKSLFKGEVKASWSALESIGHSAILGSDYIVIGGIGKVWCSNMLNGYDELVEFIESKAIELNFVEPEANKKM